jgi:hypothetical protein
LRRARVWALEFPWALHLTGSGSRVVGWIIRIRAGPVQWSAQNIPIDAPTASRSAGDPGKPPACRAMPGALTLRAPGRECRPDTPGAVNREAAVAEAKLAREPVLAGHGGDEADSPDG